MPVYMNNLLPEIEKQNLMRIVDKSKFLTCEKKVCCYSLFNIGVKSISWINAIPPTKQTHKHKHTLSLTLAFIHLHTNAQTYKYTHTHTCILTQVSLSLAYTHLQTHTHTHVHNKQTNKTLVRKISWMSLVEA